MPQCPAGPTPPIASPTRPAKPSSGAPAMAITGQVGGDSGAVAAAGNLMYVGAGPRVLVVDVSIPGKPVEIGETPILGGEVTGIAVNSGLAAVSAGSAGVYLFDVSAPKDPKLLGSYSAPGFAHGVVLLGNRYALVADGPAGFAVLDIANRQKPKLAGAAFGNNDILDVAVNGNFAYLAAADAGLLVADISKPDKPTEVGRLATPGFAYGVAVSGNTVVVADGWAGIAVVDVRDASHPKSLGIQATTSWALGVAEDSTSAYVASASGGLEVINLKKTAPFTTAGTFPVDGRAVRVVIDGGIAYLVDSFSGVTLLDVTRGGTPREIGAFSTGGFVAAAAVQQGLGYVATQTEGLRVVNLEQPARPVVVGGVATVAEGGAMAVVGNNALMSMVEPVGTLTAGSTVLGVDVSAGAPPRAGPPQALPESGVTRDLAVEGGIVYYAMESGLTIVDGRQSPPCMLSFLPTANVSTGVAVSGSLAYVGTGSGLVAVDISDPRNPRLISTLSPGGFFPPDADAVDVSGNLAALIGSSGGLTSELALADVTNPADMRGLGTLRLPASYTGRPRMLAFADGRLYVADGAAGLLAIDITDPLHPSIAAQLRVPGGAEGVVMEGHYAYVAGGSGGLIIVDRGPGPTAMVTSNGEPVADNPSTSAAVDARLDAYQAGPRTGPCGSPLPPCPSPPPGTLATCKVTTAADADPGSLRDCLQQIDTGGTVTFDPAAFPPGAPVTIQPHQPLSIYRDNITLDATGAGVVIDGSALAGGNGGSDGLVINSNGNTVSGLEVIHFPGSGIALGGSHTTIARNVLSGNGIAGLSLCCAGPTDDRIVGNRIGTDATGSKALGNGHSGISVGGAKRITIGGPALADRNVISGNGQDELDLKGLSDSVIENNYIGTDVAGSRALDAANRQAAILMYSGCPRNVIKNNVIAGTLTLTDDYTSYNEVFGNMIGTDASGAHRLALAGGEANVTVASTADFNRIGGSTPSDRNVVTDQVAVAGPHNVVIGNAIGVSVDYKTVFWPGSLPSTFPFPPNGFPPVDLQGSDDYVLDNSIAGGAHAAIQLSASASFDLIAGNYVGTDAAGAAVLVPSAGIVLEDAWNDFIQDNVVATASGPRITIVTGSASNWVRDNKLPGSGPGLADMGKDDIASGNSS